MSEQLFRGRDVVGRKLDGTFFLVHLKTDRMFGLNQTGARIWELIGEGRSRASLHAALAAEFEAPPSVIARDVHALIEELVAQKLIEIGEGRQVTAPNDKPQANAPVCAWVLRWDAHSDFMPDLISVGSSPGVVATVSESGDFFAFDGYLFDPGERGQGCASRLASGFARGGNGALADLRGAFAAAVWERARRRVMVMRDALGLSPCYYWWDGQVLLLSTTLEGLLSQPEVTRAVNSTLLAEYVYHFSCSEQREETYFRSIRRVPPAHLLFVDASGLRLERYWDPVPPGFAWASPEEVASVDSLLQQAVARCMSVGADSIALSGGFDSVCVAALAERSARARESAPLAAISLHFPGELVDESSTQRAVAEALSLRQRLSAFPELSSPAAVDRALAHSTTSAGPILSPWQWMYDALLSQARDVGTGRMLMGTGGDEMFTVDPCYSADLLGRLELGQAYDFVRAWQRTSPYSPWRVACYLLWQRGLRKLAAGSALGRRYRQYRTARSGGHALWMKRLGAGPDITAELLQRKAESKPVELLPGEGHYVRAIRELPQSPALSNEFEQAASWALSSGVELLYPFFDRDLVSLTLRVHPTSLFSSGWMKAPLRAMVSRTLPGVEIPRKKVDFTATGERFIQAGGSATWQRLGGAKRLAELNIVDTARTERFIEESFERTAQGRFWKVWSILSAEAWSREQT